MRLVVDAIGKSFEEKQVLNGASFQFEKGKIYGLLGRNGAGKTTLFNCISQENMTRVRFIWKRTARRKTFPMI